MVRSDQSLRWARSVHSLRLVPLYRSVQLVRFHRSVRLVRIILKDQWDQSLRLVRSVQFYQ